MSKRMEVLRLGSKLNQEEEERVVKRMDEVRKTVESVLEEAGFVNYIVCAVATTPLGETAPGVITTGGNLSVALYAMGAFLEMIYK